jgi:hypothetical protein
MSDTADAPKKLDVSKLTPQERARLAMEMLRPKDPERRVVSETTPSGGATVYPEAPENGADTSATASSAPAATAPTPAPTPTPTPATATATAPAPATAPGTGAGDATTAKTAAAGKPQQDRAAKAADPAAEASPGKKKGALGFLSGLADKMEEKVDRIKHDFAERVRRKTDEHDSGDEDEPKGAASREAKGSAHARAVAAALGVADQIGEALKRPTPSSSSAAAAADAGGEEEAGSVEVQTGSGALAAGKSSTPFAQDPSAGPLADDSAAACDAGGLRQRKAAAGGAKPVKGEGEPRGGETQGSAAIGGAHPLRNAAATARDLEVEIPRVTIETVCERLKTNVGFMRTEYQLSSSKLSLLEFVVYRALSDDPEIIFDDPGFAFGMLSLNVGTIHRDTWCKLADAMPCIAHVSLMGDVFDAITHGAKTMSWSSFVSFARELLRAQHPVDEAWEKASKRGDIRSDEPLVARFSAVTNRTTQPHTAGILFVTRDHLVHISSVLARVTVRVPLANVVGWAVTPCGGVVPGREVAVDLDGGRGSIVFHFPYMTDICTRGEEHRADEFARCLTELEATRKYATALAERKAESEGWATFATQHLVLARAIVDAGGDECGALFLSSNPSKRNMDDLLREFEKRHILSRSKAPVVYRSKRDPQLYRGVPFDLMLFAHHIDALIDCIEPYNVAERFVIHVLHWRSPRLTAGLFALALALAWLDLVNYLPSLILLFAAYLVSALAGLTTIEGTVVYEDESKKSGGFFSNLKGNFEKMHSVHDGLQTTQNKLVSDGGGGDSVFMGLGLVLGWGRGRVPEENKNRIHSLANHLPIS